MAATLNCGVLVCPPLATPCMLQSANSILRSATRVLYSTVTGSFPTPLSTPAILSIPPALPQHSPSTLVRQTGHVGRELALIFDDRCPLSTNCQVPFYHFASIGHSQLAIATLLGHSLSRALSTGLAEWRTPDTTSKASSTEWHMFVHDVSSCDC